MISVYLLLDLRENYAKTKGAQFTNDLTWHVKVKSSPVACIMKYHLVPGT